MVALCIFTLFIGNLLGHSGCVHDVELEVKDEKLLCSAIQSKNCQWPVTIVSSSAFLFSSFIIHINC